MEESKKIHAHVDSGGTEYSHAHSQLRTKRHIKVHIKEHGNTHSRPEDISHNHSHGEGHSHTHKNTKVVLDRLSRAGGHLESVKRMVLEGKDCSEVLIQLSAVIAALNNTGKVILKDHIENCIVEAVESGDKDALDHLNSAIDRFIK